MSERWRGIVAALLNPDLRTVLAEAIGDRELSDRRRETAAERLVELGLIRTTSEGFAFDEAVLRELLAEQPRPRPTGPQRFLDGTGRIDRYPVQAGERLSLLRWVAEQAFAPAEVLSESETNARLARFTDDVAVLRRYLVDAELLERTRSGSEYALVDEGSDASGLAAGSPG